MITKNYTKFREIVLQLLYSRQLGGDGDLVSLVDVLKVPRQMVRLAAGFVHDQIEQQVGEIDQEIATCVEGYRFARLCPVELSVLRLAIFEIGFSSDHLPPKIAIAEAIRLARKFGSPEGGRFVNAVLDRFYWDRERQKEAAVS